jgi:hypothetical protein
MSKNLCLVLCGLGLSIAAHAAPPANDFPTQDRVLYVQECMVAHEHPGANNFEMVSKCSCALDALAREITYSKYVEMSTAAKAFPMAGERGNVVRDSDQMRADIKRYRALQAKANQGCFLGPANKP